jgi:predicted TIM-barrel fold metal-dependent hydrolase
VFAFAVNHRRAHAFGQFLEQITNRQNQRIIDGVALFGSPSTIHTHAEVSCWNPFDNYGEEYDRAADKYFGSNRRPTIEETMAYYREKKIGLVMFTVDSESQLGRRRIPNEEICEAAQKNSDMMIAFASIDPHKGKMGAREARRLIESTASRASSSTPRCRASCPTTAWPGRCTR